jgi:hypothetical protein
MLAIAGAAVDVAALHSAFKSAGLIAEATTEFNTALNDAAVVALEQKLAKIAALDARIQKNIVKQARIQAQQQKLLSSMVAARGLLTVTIPGLVQTGELVARAVFAIQKGAVSLDTFIAELKAAKLIADTGLTPEELLLVKDAFTRAQTLAADEKWVAELEKAISEGDWVRVKGLVDGTITVAYGPIVNGGARLEYLGNNVIRIQSIATKYNIEITVVGSRAKGTANAFSDWDYIITGGTSKTRNSALYQLPRNLNAAKDGISRSGSEILKGVKVDPNLPHIIFKPSY